VVVLRDNAPMTDPVPSRRPLDATELATRLAAEGGAGPNWSVRAVAETASTNRDLAAAAEAGQAEGAVLVAEFQSGGRGRLDRSWSSPPGAGLTMSLLLRPPVPLASWGWLPLLAGVALQQVIGGSSRLKWPNDLLIGPEALKAAGILAQTAAGAAVIGIGLNVSTTADELPVPTATSLRLQGYPDLDRAALVVRLLGAIGGLYRDWLDAEGDAEACGLAARYRRVCATIGTDVTVDLGERVLAGTVLDLDSSGRLLLRPDGQGEPIAVASGDVTHLRPASG
jgi:BirA family biotin operon repressor/biotin-[acetyl-CoA-carboxylase] ligase